MFNDLKIGPVTIHMYGLMIAIGFLSALLLTSYRGKKRGMNDDIIWGIFFCAIFGGMAGSRILYYIVELPRSHWGYFDFMGFQKWLCGVRGNHRRCFGELHLLQISEGFIFGIF